MNRSILIVICDFLLVSLLAFSTVDINKVTNPTGERNLKLEMSTNRMDSHQDLGNVMRLALEDERKKRDALVAELVNTRDAASKQLAMLSEREKQIAVFQQEIKAKDQQTTQLHQQQKNLEQQYATAQTNIQGLNQELQRSTGEALLSKEKLAEMEAEVRKKMATASDLQQQLSQLSKSNQIALAERQQLSTQLQVAEAEKRNASEQAAFMREEVKIERQEKAKLAEGVKSLAQEIHEGRSLAPNTIFSEFVTNRVMARFNASRSTLLGIDSTRDRATQTMLVTDGIRTFAMCHVQDTPLVLWNPGIDWESLTGTLSASGESFPIQTLCFHQLDPRVVYIPVTDSQALKLHGKVYRVAADPFKFQDAVLVGANEGYYGECKFQMDLSCPQYLKMDHNSLKGLFGKFNPSRGDLVFSKAGELLGVMANNTYCLVIHDFGTMASFRFGQDIRNQRTGDTLTRLGLYVQSLPLKLQ